eukprot:328662_1
MNNGQTYTEFLLLHPGHGIATATWLLNQRFTQFSGIGGLCCDCNGNVYMNILVDGEVQWQSANPLTSSTPVEAINISLVGADTFTITVDYNGNPNGDHACITLEVGRIRMEQNIQ